MKIQRWQFLILLSVICAAPAVGGNGDYQTALTLRQYRSTDKDSDYTARTLAFYYYLREVETDGLPLGEAAYLKRVSRMAFSIIAAEYESPIYLDSESERYTVSYYSRSPDSPFTFYLYYYNSDTDFTNNSGAYRGRENRKKYTVSGGYYVSRNTLVTLGYTRQKRESNDFALSYASSDEYYISAKHILLNADNSAWNFSGFVSREDFSSNESNDFYGVNLDYYFTPNYSMGIDLDQAVGDRKWYNGTRMEVNGTAFLSPHFSISFEVAQFSVDDQTVRNNEDMITISAGLRF